MINKVAALLIFFTITLTTRAQIFNDARDAFRVASESNKPVLLIFAGSDWCAPCIRFENEILNEPGFLAFAADHLVLLKADFPQRKQLPLALQQQNDGLAERYNPKGQFPYLVLLAADQHILASVPYTNQHPADFIAELKQFIDHE